MRCPIFLCHCTVHVCLHREMQKTPGKQRRATHARRKFNELQKERAKYKDGQGWSRALRSKLDAEARTEARVQANYMGTNMPSWLKKAYEAEHGWVVKTA